MPRHDDTRWDICPECRDCIKINRTDVSFRYECFDCGDVHEQEERLPANEVPEYGED